MRKSDQYKELFNKEFLMGPNSMRLLEEMLEKYPIEDGLKVMDLGCGRGLTSLYLAKETNADVYATDLWIRATDNYELFKEWKMDEKMIPIHSDANDLPFAHEYFDAIVSIDSFHYFAHEKNFFKEKVLPFVKKDGVVILAMPGLAEEIHGMEDDIILEWLGGEESEYEMFHSLDWWTDLLGNDEEYDIVSSFELDCFKQAWEDWFASGHEFAARDGEFFARGLDQYLNFVGLVIKRK